MYDIAIVGAGAAGISCAREAVRKRLKVALIENKSCDFGGICLNKGCIPAKFFLNNAKKNRSWENSFPEKEKIITNIRNSSAENLKKQGIDVIWGKAAFGEKGVLGVDGKKVEAGHFVIATGSLPRRIADDSRIVLPEDVLGMQKIPDEILIIGAGYIGIEFACLFNALGKIVTVVEKEDRILPVFNKHLAKRLSSILARKGLNINVGADFGDYNLDEYGLVVSAVGRTPNISGLEIEKAGVSLNKKGWVGTDSFLKTSKDNIYACGDVNGKLLLAYVAEYQGRLCVNNISSKPKKEDYSGLAQCVFSIPQVATAGFLEEELQERGIDYEIVKSNFLRFSSTYSYGDTDGFIKMAIGKNGEILGAGVISQAASELINLLSLCIKNNMKVAELKEQAFPHPTLSEIIPAVLRTI